MKQSIHGALGVLFVTAVMGCVSPALADDDERSKARERMPQVIEWQGHYLVLEGENFLPVERGLVTPNVSLFKVEEGYLPSGAITLETEIEGCDPAESGGRRVTDTGEAESALMAEAAMDYASAEARRGELRQYCPESLGRIFGSGSYVFDGDYNQLAGQDFDEGIGMWLGRFLYGEKEQPKDVLIIGEGGVKRAEDPALDIYTYDNGMIVDVLFDPATYNGRQDPGLGDDGVAPAPELPVTVAFRVGEGLSDFDSDGLPTMEAVIGQLDMALTDPINAALFESDILLISRGATPETFEKVAKRLDVIENKLRERIGEDANISVVSLGVAVPVCDDTDPDCWYLNRSTLLYFRPR
ncbi:MAG: hypothetical protein QNI84_13695 [Henriciella sp.]|nr:hypothetical protein [Henriciella sp.]